MKIDAKKLARKIVGLLSAILLYYIIHEGAHLLFAISTNSFEKIVFMFPGMQIKVDYDTYSVLEKGIFNLVGVLATLTAAYTLCLLKNKIATIKSNIIRAIFYYATIMFLMCDAIYLSLLCDIFGGGDMNGISLIIPEIFARITLFIVAVLNIFVIFKFIVPTYKKAYEKLNIKVV